jgi:D-arabinose 1-dehydrogenase-like Zn-dependent alcohol dehydrogenase
VSTPEPGPGQVLIKIHASGLWYTDVHQTRGELPDGRLVVMGFEPKPLPLSIGDLIMRRIRVLGSQQNSREYLYEALRFVAEGRVRVLAETYPLAEIARAYDRVEAGQVRFRAVVTV